MQRKLWMLMISWTLILPLGTVCRAQDVTFSKTKYSSVQQARETDVTLSLTGSKIMIKSTKVSKKEPAIDVEIPYTSVVAVSYELASRHRVAEGAAVMTASLGAGALLMATKTKSHWLTIQYKDGGSTQSTVLHLDKSEYEGVISAMEAKTGKTVARLDAKTSPLNPTAESTDRDEVVPYAKDNVAAALKTAMESQGCKVTDATGDSIECKRARGGSERTGTGGEKVKPCHELLGLNVEGLANP